MKKQLFLALILIFAIGLLMAGTPRVYIQKCVVETAPGVFGEAPGVMNTGVSTSPDYIVHATNLASGDVLGTDLGDPLTTIRIYRAGNGTSVPYYTATYVQLGTFSPAWAVGNIIQMWVQYIPTGATATWEMTIPTGTSTITLLDPAQQIPGPPIDEDTWTYNLGVTASDGGAYAFTGPMGGTTPTVLTDDDDEMNELLGDYTVTDPAPAGWFWANPTITVTADMFTAAKTDFVYNAAIQFVLEEEVIPDTWTYNLGVTASDGGAYAFTGPMGGTTPTVLTDNDDMYNELIGDYTVTDPAPAGWFWANPTITVTADMFIMAKTDYVYNAAIQFVLEEEIIPDTWTYNLAVTASDGGAYAFTGPQGGTTPVTLTDGTDMTNDLLGDYTVTTPAPAGWFWANPTITVTSDMFTMAKTDYVYNAAIQFVLEEEVIPDTWTYNLAVTASDGGAYAFTGPIGGITPTTLVDNDDAINELVGDYTVTDPAPAGWHWVATTITVSEADFVMAKTDYVYNAEIQFVLEEDCVPGFTFEVNAFDLAWYIGAGYQQGVPGMMPPHLDPNDVNAEIWYDNDIFDFVDPVFTGVYTPYIFGACGNLPFNPGLYYVMHPDYVDWQPADLYIVDITHDYLQDFLGIDGTVPVELSSFTATLTAQNYVQLTWVSQTESQMMGYLVYRNTTPDQSTAVMIDQPMIPATNTSTTQTYTATDSDVQIGTTYYYWLEALEYSASTYHGPVTVIVEGEVPPVLPELTTMKNAYPNPFKANGSTNIEVSLKAGENGNVTIYNVLGQIVRSFSVSEGTRTITWNGRDSKGNACGSGIYFYKLSTPSMNVTKKMVIVK